MSTNIDYKAALLSEMYKEKYTRIKPTKLQDQYFAEWFKYENDFTPYAVTTTTTTNPCKEISLTSPKIDENYIFGMILGATTNFYIEAYYNIVGPRSTYKGFNIDLYAHIQIYKDTAPYLNFYYGRSFIAKAKQIMVNNTTSLLDYLYANREVMERFIVSGDPRIVWCI